MAWKRHKLLIAQWSPRVTRNGAIKVYATGKPNGIVHLKHWSVVTVNVPMPAWD